VQSVTESHGVGEGRRSNSSSVGSRGKNSTGRQGINNILRAGGRGNRNNRREHGPMVLSGNLVSTQSC